ncbi:MAG: aldo/keto reductase [Pseudomonadota bacterium]
MEKRFLGRSGLQVSALSYGVMTFGGDDNFKVVGNTQVDEARRLVDLSIDHGVTLFDTADIYSDGLAESILGEVLEGRRQDVLVATKAFGTMGPGDHDVGLSRRHLIDACDASLRRLRTDWIDLYQVHGFDSYVPLEETLRALDDLVRSGKVRYIGCSNYFAWQLTRALGLSERAGLERFIGQQIQYSLLVRDAEIELLPAGIEQGVGALIWSPLAGGYLTGKFRDAEASSSRLAQSDQLGALDTARPRAVVDALFEVAGELDGATPSQVALAWLQQRPGVTSVIIGARNEAQLLDNLKAAELTLSDAAMRKLDAVSHVAKGYPFEHQQRWSFNRSTSPFPES